MSRLFKKISAIILTAIMVLTMCSTVFADGTQVSENDKATVTITELNTDETPTVTLYKVVKGDYSENGFLGTYTKATGVEIDIDNPTDVQINKIAQDINTIVASGYSDGTKIIPISATVNGATATATVNGAGVYIALITGVNNTVYNPVYVGVSYAKDAQGQVVLTHEAISVGELYDNSQVAKKTSPKSNKEITGGTTEDTMITTGTDKGTVSVGDVVSYKLTPTVPSYPANAINKTFFVGDTMTAGLDFDFSTLDVKLGTDDSFSVTRSDEDGVATFTAKKKDAETGVVIATAQATADGNRSNGFNLNFDYEELYKLNTTEEGVIAAIPKITVTYRARVNENAVVGKDGNTNTATIYYANEPNTGKTWEKTDEKPTPSEANGIKEKEDKKTVYTYQIALKKIDAKKDGDGNEVPLEGAVFGIYKDANATEKDAGDESKGWTLSGSAVLVDEITTNSNGFAVSTAVEAGNYYVKELVAPTGYQVSDKVYKVTAQWTSATTTVDGTITRTKYTTDTNNARDNKQVGWIKLAKVGDTTGTFYSMEQYTSETETVKKAYVAKDGTSTTTTSTVTTDENGAGTVATLVTSPVPNTTLSQLPSTGGMGTYIFTIVGVVLMVCAAGAFMVSRKKSED